MFVSPGGFEGKGRQFLQDCLKPDAIHAGAGQLGDVAIWIWVELGCQEWVPVEGEVGVAVAWRECGCLSRRRGCWEV